MDTREAVTIAQVRVPDGTNEITQADAILDTVEIPAGESVLVTLDAAHTQRETAETIGGKSGWDYLMTVKGNQVSIHGWRVIGHQASAGSGGSQGFPSSAARMASRARRPWFLAESR